MPMRQNHEGGNYYNPIIRNKFRLMAMTKVATAEMAIGAEWPPVLLLDPGGAGRTVLLPPEADCKDQVFFIRNTADAAETLTVEEDSSTTAILVLAQGEGAMVHCDGTTWRSFETDIA